MIQTNSISDTTAKADPVVRLAIFAKTPVAGKVKTRLAASIGHAKALNCYERLLVNTIAVAMPFNPEIWFEGNRRDISWSRELRSIKQPEGDLGRRMLVAFADGVDVLIGVDCPEMSTEYIQSAIDRLQETDVVLGPVEDGGYCLIASRHAHSKIFEGIDWGTSRVLSQTLERIDQLNLTVSLLPTTWDLDVAADYDRWLTATESGDEIALEP